MRPKDAPSVRFTAQRMPRWVRSSSRAPRALLPEALALPGPAWELQSLLEHLCLFCMTNLFLGSDKTHAGLGLGFELLSRAVPQCTAGPALLYNTYYITSSIVNDKCAIFLIFIALLCASGFNNWCCRMVTSQNYPAKLLCVFSLQSRRL